MDKDSDQNIKVFVRARPLSEDERTKNILEVSGPRELLIKERPFEKNARRFTFDRVFGPKSQQVDIYRTVVSPLVSEVIAGYNCTVFAYGQTGTGKTFTMEGEKSNDASLLWYEDPQIGIIPRALSHLFNELRILQGEYSVKVSFLELYNEELLDLLSPVEDSNKIKLYEDATKKGSVIVSGLHELTVRNKNEVYGIMEKGSMKRQTAATMLNAHSSRSHTIFTITVHIRENAVEDDELIKCGKLNLVDLAGSENIGRSGATEKRAREAGNINQSLLTLGRVITSLVEKAPHIPYRESKLTRLLQESLGGRTKTSIIATISPSFCNLEETISTLEYAQRAKNIKNKPEANKRFGKKTLIKEYTEEIDRLRRDLIATRERTGIFLAKENYNELLAQIEVQKTEMAELLCCVNTLKECLEEKEKLNAELSQSLSDYNEKLERATLELQQTKGELKQTICDRNEKEHIIEHRRTTEQRLMEQAHHLLAAADRSTTDNENLHKTLDKRRLLEEDNKVVSLCFQESAIKALETSSLDIDKLNEAESMLINSLMEKLGAGCEDIKSWSSAAEQKISSVIEGHVQLQHFLNTVVHKLVPSVQLLGASRCAMDTTRGIQLKTLKESLEHCQRQMQNLKFEVAQQRDENLALREDVLAMMVQHKAVVRDLVAAVHKTMAELDTSMLQTVQELNKISEDDYSKVQSMEDANNHIMEAVKQFLSSVLSSASEIDDDCEEMIGNNSICDKILEELVHDYSDKRKQCSTSAVFSGTEDTYSRMDDRLSTFNEQTSNILHEVDENASANIHHVEDIVSSDNMTLQELFQLLKLNLSTVVENIMAIKGRHKDQSQNFIQELQSSTSIHADLRSYPVNLVEKVTKESSVDVDSHSQHMLSAHQTMVDDIKLLHTQLLKFVEEDLHCYVPSGKTPEKQDILYPRNFKFTSPHQRILERYRARPSEAESSSSPLIVGKENSDGIQENLSNAKGQISTVARKILGAQNH